MKDRIRQIMEAQHMTQQVFADFIGTTPATLSGIFNDRTKPTLNIVESIVKKIPNLNINWLMFGAGSMYNDGLAPEADPATYAQPAPAYQRQGQEAMLDFGQPATTPPPMTTAAPRQPNSVRNTRLEMPHEVVKNIDKPQRKVTEIRVYYDDQTWESFVPSKK